MEKITLNIEGTSEEVVKAITNLAGLFGQQREEKGNPHVDEDWSDEEIKRLWDLLTEGAAKVFKEVAKQPNGIDRDAILKTLGLTGNQLAGTMSSQGHAMRNFPGKTRPVELDWDTWQYKMRPEVADAIIRLGL